MTNAITATNTRHIHSECFPSIGGVGGYSWQPETSIVTWSDGTRLVVEDSRAKACYRGQWYQMPSLGTTLHDQIVSRWTVAITARLQRDLPSLADRVRAGWQSELPTQAA